MHGSPHVQVEASHKVEARDRLGGFEAGGFSFFLSNIVKVGAGVSPCAHTLLKRFAKLLPTVGQTSCMTFTLPPALRHAALTHASTRLLAAVQVIDVKQTETGVLLRVQSEGRVAVKSLVQAQPYFRAVVVPLTDSVDLDTLQVGWGPMRLMGRVGLMALMWRGVGFGAAGLRASACGHARTATPAPCGVAGLRTHACGPVHDAAHPENTSSWTILRNSCHSSNPKRVCGC